MCVPYQLKIRNFGPIRSGLTENDGYLTMSPVTVFCGAQGTGKSTAAKLYSIFLWLEKALVRGDMSVSYIMQYKRFVNKYLAYQNIQSYILPDTYIHFKGVCYDFYYEEGRFRAEAKDHEVYNRPQIMYFPAERNLLGVLDSINAATIKGMPSSLQTMVSEYRNACRSLVSDLPLPVGGASFRYDKLNQTASIVTLGSKVKLSESSSGFQSVSPLFITMNHLYETVIEGKHKKNSARSQKEQEIIDKRIHELLLDNSISDETRAALIKKVSEARNNYLISIVEEPEQNLFPSAQEELIYSLIKMSCSGDSSLVLTTHSPYVVNYLTLAVKAGQVSSSCSSTEADSELESLVPKSAWLMGDKVTVYQLFDDGTIRTLPKYDMMPSDDNLLNNLMIGSNTKYSDLVSIQCDYE